MTEAPPVASSSTAPDALLRELDGPAFAEPWMAQVFACAVHLSRNGLFTWNEWVDVFSAEIKTPSATAGRSGQRRLLPAMAGGAGNHRRAEGRGFDSRNQRTPRNLAPSLSQHAARSAGRAASRFGSAGRGASSRPSPRRPSARRSGAGQRQSGTAIASRPDDGLRHARRLFRLPCRRWIIRRHWVVAERCLLRRQKRTSGSLAFMSFSAASC